MITPERWKNLYDRYRDPDKPRKMLALDGGGIRGIVTLGMLARLESQLAAKLGRGGDFRLCEYFDYFAGTSTGAIMATGLARGMSCADLLSFYLNSGKDMFDKTSIFARLSSFYEADPLRAKMKQVFGESTTLEPEHLRALLLIVTRNVTTDSPWPISSNPDAKYNDPGRRDCNLRIPLWQLVRASTAAPVFFPPEVLNWDPADPKKTFVFVDGGVTPYNNPAFLLYRMATDPAYRLNWKTGEKQMLIVSVGTGIAPDPGNSPSSPGSNLFSNVTSLPTTLMYGIQVDQDVSCRTIGRCAFGAPIDRELGDMIPAQPLDQDLGRRFLYVRYNADLSAEGLAKLGVGDIDSGHIQKMDWVDGIPQYQRVAAAAGAQVSLAHLGPFV